MAAVAPCGPPATASALCEAIYRSTGNGLLARSSDVLIVKPAKVLVITAVALLVTVVLRRIIRRSVSGRPADRVRRGLSQSARAVQRARTIGALLRSIATFGIWSIAVLMILGELGLDLGPLVAGAGIVGIALGFGAQNLVRDFLSGIFMLLEDQYGVGDIIDAGPASGVVENVGLRTTRIRDVNGVVWHIPNGQIQRIGNKSQQWSRALLDIDVSYATDIEEAKTVIKAVADGMWRDDAYSHKVL